MLYDDIEKSLNEVTMYIDMQRYEQAINRLKQLLSINPNHSKMLYLMSFCYYKLDQCEEALELCNESLQNGFSAEDCHYLLGRIYRDLLQFSKAEEHYLECLRINPSRASALSSYGVLMLKTGHDKKALKLIDEAMRIDPSNEVVLNNKFIYYMSKGNKKTQIDSLQKYINNASSEVRKLISIGIYNMHNKKYSLAKDNFRQAFLLDPTDESILELLEQMDILSHWVFLPNRLVEKVGGPGVVWLGLMFIAILSYAFLSPIVVQTIAYLYIFFAIYTHLSPYIYRTIMKFKRK